MIPNQSLGVRIKYFRNKIGYTQKQLGDMVGLNDSTIRNYELGNRIPDIHKLEEMAKALEVDIYSLLQPDVTNFDGVIHTLFDLESMWGFVPVKIDDKVYITLDTENCYEYVSRDSSSTKALSLMIEYWHQARKALDEKKIDEDAYVTWKEKYPAFAAMTEDGIPIIPAAEEMKRATEEENLKLNYEVYVAAKKWADEDDILTFEEFKKKHK